MKDVKFLDLFCGCGGFTQGFAQAGCIPLLGVDIWADATTTYKYNFPQSKIINDDLTKLTAQDLLQVSGVDRTEIDIIIGGPPCQGFSISGKRMIDDPRNNLYKSFVNIVSDIQPKVFVMENVPGLISMANGEVKDAILEDFSNIGYNVSWKILIADDYGVPQRRRRVFFVGLNRKVFNEQYFEFPIASTKDTKITCRDAISDLDFISDEVALPDETQYVLLPDNDYQRKMRRNSDILWNHVATIHNARTKEIISMVPNGGNYLDLPQELWSTRKVHIAWTRMDSNKPCFTIDTGHNHHFHYKENRVPTARESARIQSFPDEFRFLGIKTSQLKQVGNAVPPLLAEALANKVLEYLRRQNV
ncbi:MAG: DNA cytosine methyltransferase [Clostridia bacterium]|nr:DNA cytosine methyltransferase [Clostridia bacterium]